MTGEDPQEVQSAFELLGRKQPATGGSHGMETSDAIVKAWTMAVSGERKLLPSCESASMAETVQLLGVGQSFSQGSMGSQAVPKRPEQQDVQKSTGELQDHRRYCSLGWPRIVPPQEVRLQHRENRSARSAD